MRIPRPAAAFALLCILAACSDRPTPTAAPEGPRFIVNGVPTGTAFGNVGALLFDFDQDGVIEGEDQLCSGSLIASTVFLTAAHCLSFFPADAQLFVSFDPDLMPVPDKVIAAQEFHFDPRFGHDFGDLHDLGVVILPAKSTKGIQPLQLPPAGHLDALAAKGGLVDQLFLNVGYGVDATLRGVPDFPFDGVRKVSKSEFMALLPAWLWLLMNTNATGEGGDCFGDSGSPKFIEGNTTMIVATVTTGDAVCRATSRDYRLDTLSARAFLGQFVPLP
jgi:hypothetical protein